MASRSTFSELISGEITPVPAPGIDDLLTEAGPLVPVCTPPVVGFTLAQLGLVAGDEIDVGQVNWHFLQVVPEPGSFLLLGSGVVGLLILGKRRMKP